MATSVVVLSHDELIHLSCDAKLVAIRWDLIPWCLVLDLDVRVSETKNAPIRRMWIVFEGISEISWSLDRARLPNGCWLSSEAETVALSEEFTLFKVVTLAPTYGTDGIVNANPSRELHIRSKSIAGIASTELAIPGIHGIDREQRLQLASDEEMLRVAKIALD